MPPNSSMDVDISMKWERATGGGIIGLGNNPSGKENSTAKVKATVNEISQRLACIMRTINVASKVQSAPRSNWKGRINGSSERNKSRKWTKTGLMAVDPE
jgi:hypothetical protein